MTDLVIHALGVGGGSLAISQLPGLQGAYAADLAFIRDWKPSIVVSATTRGEHAEARVESLGKDIPESGARWMHLPIEDYGTPDADFMRTWPDARDAILKALNGKGRV